MHTVHQAVMMTHDNLNWTAMFFRTCCGDFGNGDSERLVSYLPLSHIAAQILVGQGWGLD